MLSKNFQKWGIFHENLSVDEMIVRYYGHHTLKQFIKSKPIRFGHKFRALCGNDGYCYNFALYCGKETNTSESDKLPLGTKVVLNLLSIVEDPKSHRVYFDNFFTSHALLKKLKELKFRASGTIRENRTEKCPIMDDKKMSKKERGFYDSKFDTTNEILVVK
ncbi:piggyBac transposable element-derived protein 3-like [Stegodyphus dumicola]|uniref:piggyBac transposable element-derived protein 3-like n=1 Tax=Stegodyphus dumicola TaxID=202533 RepID=UPI0015ADC5E9|nr:piggyBac transposable element-derived protein 3-like [Stegodyphus dumicola]